MDNQRNQPKVSVLMAVKNSEKFVGQTIQSVLDQTFTNFEFIILDDGSTDASTQIIKQYAEADSRIKAFYLTSSIGIPCGFKYTVEKGMGEYLARIDGDDFWEPSKLTKQVALLDEKPEIGASSTFVTVVDEQGEPLDNQASQGRLAHFNAQNRSHEEWLRTFVLEGSRSAHPSMMVRKSVVVTVGNYNPLLWQLNDFDLWLRILAKYPIEIIEEPLLNYRWFPEEGGNVSSYSEAVMHRTMFEASIVFDDYFEKVPNALFYLAFKQEIDAEFSFSDYTEDEKTLIKYLILRTIQSVSWSQDAIHLIALKQLGNAIKHHQVSERLLKQMDLTPIGFIRYDDFPIFYNGSDVSPTTSTQNHLDDLHDYSESLLNLSKVYESKIEYLEKTLKETQDLMKLYKEQKEYYEVQQIEKEALQAELEAYHTMPIRQMIKKMREK